MGGLIEFPAVVDRRRRVHRQRAAPRSAPSRWCKGTVLWTARRRRTGRWPRRPRSPAAELVYHSMDGNVFVLDRANGRLLWSYHVGSPIESSPIVQRRRRLLRRVERAALRARPARRTGCAGAGASARRSPRARPSPASTLYIGDYAGRLWALSPRTGATRWTRAVNGRIYGTPAVAGGRVFVPSSNGGSLTAFTTGGRELWRFSARRLRLLVAGGLGRPRLLRLVQRRLLRALGGERPRALGGRDRRRRSPARPSSSTASRTPGASPTGSSASTRAPAACCMRFKHGQYVPVSGNGMQLLFHGYSTLYAVQAVHPSGRSPPTAADARRGYPRPMRRRLLIVLAVLVVLAAGLGAAYVIHRMHEDRNIRGSSDGGVRPDEAADGEAAVAQRAMADVRPDHDAHALGRARAGAAVPASSGRTTRAASSSSRRRSATGACTSRPTRASSPRST